MIIYKLKSLFAKIFIPAKYKVKEETNIITKYNRKLPPEIIASVSKRLTIVKFFKKFKDGSTLLKILIIIKSSGNPAPIAKAFFVSLKLQDAKKLIPLNIPNNKNIPRFSRIKALISNRPGKEISETIIPTIIRNK